MTLSPQAAADQAGHLYKFHTEEREALDTLRLYWRGRQALPAVIPSNAPREVRTLARIARVNICGIIIDSLAQSLYVDGFRGKNDGEDTAVWDIWQANKLDARQTGIHRASFAYRASYAVVLPGDPVPVIRGVSPRSMTAIYGEDPDWPMWALERCGGLLWKLYDDESIYYLQGNQMAGTGVSNFTFLESKEHGLGVTPVIRFLDEDDLDADDDVVAQNNYGYEEVPMGGQVAPVMPIQDQIDLTTFGLLVAQWYSAFRQRWAIGWTAEDEKERAKAAASQLWTFDENPDDMKLGEFSETNLEGYIKSRDSAVRYAATLSQTPVHEMLGDLINLSADAVALARDGHDAKVDERKILAGESHEQMLRLAGKAGNVDVPDDAQVVWRDTSARTFAATVDALGKLTQMLGIPPQELWERVPGATSQDVARWKAAAAKGDSFAVLRDMLDRQTTTDPGGTNPSGG